MKSNFNPCEPCSENVATSLDISKTTKNVICEVKCSSKTVEVFSSVTIEATKSKQIYFSSIDGMITWLIETEDGDQNVIRTITPFFDYSAPAEHCYKKVRIYPYLTVIDRNVYVELTIVNNIEIQPRSSWGAKDPIIEEGRSYEKIEEDVKNYYDAIVIHHSGNDINFPTMKQVQEKHFDEKRADIGYHFGVDRDGVVYEGRDINYKGSHVNKGNSYRIGVLLLADLSTDDAGLEPWKKPFEWSDGELTQDMEKGLLRLCLYLDQKYEITSLGGHNEFAALLGDRRPCPGNLAIAKMAGWRKILNKESPQAE